MPLSPVCHTTLKKSVVSRHLVDETMRCIMENVIDDCEARDECDVSELSLKEAIKDAITTQSAFIVASLEGEIDKYGTPHPNEVSKERESFIYTIGLHEKGLPEILVFTGPTNPESKAFTGKEALDVVNAAMVLVRWMSTHPSEFKYAIGENFKDDIRRLYQSRSLISKQELTYKTEFTPEITEYYQHTNYRLFVLHPINWIN